MIPFCLFQCNSNRMSAAAFGPAQAPSAACPARPRSPHGRRALAAPTRRCAVTDDTPLQMPHHPRRCAALDATPSPTPLCCPDDTLPQTLHRHRHYTATDAAAPSRRYAATDATPPPTLHRPRRCAVPTIRCHRCYTTPDATPPSTLRRHRRYAAPVLRPAAVSPWQAIPNMISIR